MSILKQLRALFFGPDPEALSGHAAKDRLKLVLMHDRSDIPATMMEAIRAEMVMVLLKYLEIDQDALEVQIEKEQGTIGLTLNIPIRRVRREDEAPEAYAAAAALLSPHLMEPTLPPAPEVPLASTEDESQPDKGAEARQKLKEAKAGGKKAKAVEEPAPEAEGSAEDKGEATASAAD